MKKLKIILAVLLALVILFVGFVLSRPGHLTVQRELVINAPAHIIFPFINDLNEHSKWDPWDDADPTLKSTLSEKKVGVGAMYTWDGNDEVGKGVMTIKESNPNSLVLYDLEFIKPIEGKATSGFQLSQVSESKTKVVETYNEDLGFMGKLFSIFMDMDKMIGDQFVKGLNSISELSERSYQAYLIRKAKEEEEKARLAQAQAQAAISASAQALVTASQAVQDAARVSAQAADALQQKAKEEVQTAGH